eukprot:scaffold123463_cov45-Prasinocladus_malaysianus.AAC.2
MTLIQTVLLIRIDGEGSYMRGECHLEARGAREGVPRAPGPDLKHPVAAVDKRDLLHDGLAGRALKLQRRRPAAHLGVEVDHQLAHVVRRLHDDADGVDSRAPRRELQPQPVGPDFLASGRLVEDAAGGRADNAGRVVAAVLGCVRVEQQREGAAGSQVDVGVGLLHDILHLLGHAGNGLPAGADVLVARLDQVGLVFAPRVGVP